MSFLFLMAREHPAALTDDAQAQALATQWLARQATNLGDPYGARMQARLRRAFLAGLHHEPRPVQQSNFERPLRSAYWAGRELAALLSNQKEE